MGIVKKGKATIMFGRVFDRVLTVNATVAIAFVAILWISITYEVFMRYFLNSPTKWVTDFAGYWIIYLTFLGAAWLLAKEGHVKIELVLSALPPKAQRILNVITSVIGALVCAMLFWYSLEMTLTAFQDGSTFRQAIQVPRWPVFAVIPFGTLTLIIQFLRRAWGYARERKVPEKEAAEEGF